MYLQGTIKVKLINYNYQDMMEGSCYHNKKFRLDVEGQELEQTENFVYLGGNISTQEGSDKYVERRIGLSRGTWQALGKV